MEVARLRQPAHREVEMRLPLPMDHRFATFGILLDAQRRILLDQPVERGG